MFNMYVYEIHVVTKAIRKFFFTECIQQSIKSPLVEVAGKTRNSEMSKSPVPICKCVPLVNTAALFLYE